MRNLKKSKGFTLVELMYVVVIISIIVAIAIPNYIRTAQRAKEAVVRENMHSVQLAIEVFCVKSLGEYPQSGDEPELRDILPQRQYPKNPFTLAETDLGWDSDPATPGDMGIYNLPGGGYMLRGHGAKGLLNDIVAGN